MNKLNQWLEKKLYFPGITNTQLQSNISVFDSHIFLAIVSLMIYAIPLSIFAPQATIYIHYMIAFSGIYSLSLLLQLIFTRHHLLINAFIVLMMYLVTFYAIIQLGGIATSGGLIYAGVAVTISTLQRQKTWLPISMFSIFAVWVVLLVVLKPWLHVPAQLTPALNEFLWMSNSIIVIGEELVFGLRFIRQRNKFEEAEARHLKEINELKDRFFYEHHPRIPYPPDDYRGYG